MSEVGLPNAPYTFPDLSISDEDRKAEVSLYPPSHPLYYEAPVSDRVKLACRERQLRDAVCALNLVDAAIVRAERAERRGTKVIDDKVLKRLLEQILMLSYEVAEALPDKEKAHNFTVHVDAVARSVQAEFPPDAPPAPAAS